MNEDKIIAKLLEHDDKFDKVINRLEDHDVKFDKVITKLLEHDDQFVQIIKKIDDDVGGLRREMLDGQDQMMTILKRLDQERIFTVEWIKRMEKDIETHGDEIKRIKLQLKIA
jgi:hypothetical protein